MALHLNLNHEIERVRLARKRDPLKLSLWGLSVIAACFAAYYFVALARAGGVSQELARKKAEFESIEAQSKAGKGREEELAQTKRASEALVHRIENRFYWAPMLEELIKVVPREVQITKLAGEVKGEGLKTCKITVDGLSAGADPRKVAEDLRTAIAESFGKKYKNVASSFRSLEDGMELVKLDGKSAPTATFGINVELQSGEEPAAPVAARAPKK